MSKTVELSIDAVQAFKSALEMNSSCIKNLLKYCDDEEKQIISKFVAVLNDSLLVQIKKDLKQQGVVLED